MVFEEPRDYIQSIRYHVGKEHLDDVFATKLDVYQSVGSPYVSGQMYLWDLLDTIRYNIQPTIMLLPKYVPDKKGNVSKNPPYEKYKANMEAVCYPATFKRYKNLSNLKEITNLMFLDIDVFKRSREAHEYRSKITMQYDWIIACNLSVSGIGLHILIKVDKIIDNDDYNLKYDYISKNFFQGNLDKKSKSLTRFTIIPFDPDPYINEAPTTLPIHKIIHDERQDAIGSLPKTTIDTYASSIDIETVPTSSLIIDDKSVSKKWVQFNNFRTLNGYDQQGILFSRKKDIIVVEAKIGVGLKTGQRNSVLSSYANNLLWLNPTMTEDLFAKIVNTINTKCFLEPLNVNEVNKIIKNKQSLLKNDELRPICSRRMIVFHPDCKLSREDKNRIVLDLLARNKTLKSREKIYAILENWDFETYGKISIRKIAGNYPINKKTVAKYYGEFKSFISCLNESYENPHPERS